MSDILKHKYPIESAFRKAMDMNEADHFWLRIDMQRMYLREICIYSEQMYKRLTASTLFQNWWIVQCLHIEEKLYNAIKHDDAAPTEKNYENVARTRLNRKDVRDNYLYIVSRVLKTSKQETEIS